MSELVGRFLSFEEHMGRDLVKFVYYVLLFLLVVTTLYDLVIAVISMFSGPFWPNLGRFLVLIPLKFFVTLLLLRVGAELVVAVLSIDDNLQHGPVTDDELSSGLNPAPVPVSRMAAEPETARSGAAEPETPEPAAEEEPKAKPAATKKAAAKKPRTKKAAKSSPAAKKASPPNKAKTGENQGSSPTEAPGPAKDTEATKENPVPDSQESDTASETTVSKKES